MTHDLNSLRLRIEEVLDARLSSSDVPEPLLSAMRYATLGGGKRIRALLVYAAGIAHAAPIQALDHVAAALECIHSYSLIHDDLPAMDDDDLRRGLATTHVKFDEATAILAGDALQTRAFELICASDSKLSDAQCRSISLRLQQAAGWQGMVAGQCLDIEATGKSQTQAQLEAMHRGKTGAIIRAAVICGALCSEQTTAGDLNQLDEFAENLGLAFQVVDDVLDVESSTEVLGKQAGADAALGKSTYPALIGLEESKALATKLYHQAIASIAPMGDNSALLVEIADLVVNRRF